MGCWVTDTPPRVAETWPRLLESKLKPKNMYSWYDRQTALDEQVKKEAKERKDKLKEEEKQKEKDKDKEKQNDTEKPIYEDVLDPMDTD